MAFFDSILFSLLYPWMRFLLLSAYWQYTLTESYSRRCDMIDREFATSMFIEFEAEDMMKQAFFERPFRVIFWPFGILVHPDLMEFFAE